MRSASLSFFSSFLSPSGYLMRLWWMAHSVLVIACSMSESSASVRLHWSNWPSSRRFIAIWWTSCWSRAGVGSVRLRAAASMPSQSSRIAASRVRGRGPG